MHVPYKNTLSSLLPKIHLKIEYYIFVLNEIPTIIGYFKN